MKCLFDVGQGFARISELKKKADLDPGRVKPSRRVGDLLDPRTLLHRVEHGLRSGFGPQPDRLRTSSRQGYRGIAFDHEVSSIEALKRRANAAVVDFFGELLDPAGL